MLLAVDTSTDRLCLALVGLAGHEEPGGAAASQRLLPAAQALLQRHNLAWSDLTAVAVTVGPGAFAGVRAGCAAAQGLALGLDIPVIPLGSLDVVAWDAVTAAPDTALSGPGAPVDQAWTVRVAMDARMEQVYDASWRRTGQHWAPLTPPTVRAPQHVALQWLGERAQQDQAAGVWPGDGGGVEGGDGCGPAPGRREIWAGSGLSLLGQDALTHARDRGVVLCHEALDRPGALARLTAHAWREGRTVEAARLLPVYVRDRVALTTAERAAAGGR